MVKQGGGCNLSANSGDVAIRTVKSPGVGGPNTSDLLNTGDKTHREEETKLNIGNI